MAAGSGYSFQARREEAVHGKAVGVGFEKTVFGNAVFRNDIRRIDGIGLETGVVFQEF
jgi:RNase P protein component